jgi:hypothetical protein
LYRKQHKKMQAQVADADFSVRHLERPLQGVAAFGHYNYDIDPYQVFAAGPAVDLVVCGP